MTGAGAVSVAGCRARFVERGAAAWWAGLRDLEGEEPAGLWVAGAVDPQRPAVAVVGARRATRHAVEWATVLSAGLARRGLQVISGMAIGVDGAAHEGALAAGGSTVGVLGCGIDVAYPRPHADLRRRVVRAGCLLSEEPPGTAPAPWLFPKRNRLIAALADTVVIVEAAERSGALITADLAVRLDRDLFVCPANRGSHSVGSNRLLRDGAAVCTELDDLFAASPRLAAAAERHAAAGTTDLRPAPPGPLSARILNRLALSPAHPDELLVGLGVDARTLAVELTRLERAGLASRRPGGLVGVSIGALDTPGDAAIQR